MRRCFLLFSPSVHPLPASPDQLFPLSAAYNRAKPYIKSVFLHNRPCMFFSLSLSVSSASLPLCLAVELAQAKPRSASLSALFCTTWILPTQQQINSVAKGKGCVCVEGGGPVYSTTVPFKTVAMETPLSSPFICVYVAGFDWQIKAHWGKSLF